jgi:hypothetical protein
MSFLPAVQREINSRKRNDRVRITLEYLQNHVGCNNAVPLRKIVGHLNQRGVSVTGTGFQQTILADSRGADYFIGSGPRGYFLIDSIQDAQEMRNFYENRIRKEKENLASLRRPAAAVGWSV